MLYDYMPTIELDLPSQRWTTPVFLKNSFPIVLSLQGPRELYDDVCQTGKAIPIE
jgi:hypothetical protein